ISELVNAAKDMVIAATATQTPLRAGEVSAGDCEPRSGFRAMLDILSHPPIPFSKLGSGRDSACLAAQMALVAGLKLGLRRILHDEISVRAIDPIFVRAVIDNDLPPAKIVKRGWRGCGPLK